LNKTSPGRKTSAGKSHRKSVTIYEDGPGNVFTESDVFFDMLSENSPDMVFRAHYLPSFGFDYVSPSVTRITGYTPEEFFADPNLPQKCALPEDLHLVKDPSPPGTPPLSEPVTLRWRRKDGSIIWTEHFVMINRNRRGEAETCLIIARDVTERQKSEEALRESEDKFSKAFRCSPDRIVISTLEEGRFVDVNDAYLRFTGFTRKEVIGRSSVETGAWANPGQRAEIVRKLKKEGHVYNEETGFRLKSGEVHTSLFSAELINIKGEPCMISIATDITERKKAEEALQESQKFVSSLLENAPHATVVINPDTSVRYVNPAWEHLNGWTLSEVVGMKAPYPWWPEQLKEAFTEGFKEAMRQGSGKGEVIAVKKNGELYWIDMNWAPVMHNGELQYLLINSIDVTERKIAEEKRQAILKTALDGFWICDLQGRFLEVNDSYCAMTGYSQEELLKMSIKDVEARQNPESIRRRIKKIIARGSDRFETQHRGKDGRLIDIEISVKYYNTGEEQLFVFVRDITERKASEKALRESEEKFSKAFHASPGSVSISRLRDGKFIAVNESFLRDKGYSRQEIIGRSSFDFTIWADPEEGRRMIKILKDGGKVHNAVMQYHTRSGYVRTGLVSAEIINIGNEPCMIVLNNDITQQKQAEEKLQSQRHLIENILATMPEGVLVVDAGDRVILANESIHRILHRTRHSLINRPIQKIITTDQLLKLYESVKLGQKETGTLEFRYRVRSFEKIIICVAIKMDGERTLLTFTDVSREREEEEKLYLTDRLASIGEMAAGLAHELNNPLTGILSLSQLLVDSDIPPESREDLQCINDEARRAAGIVKNVLLFARNNNYENGQASANEVVKDILRLREYEEKTSNINIVAQLQPDLPEVPVDKYQLQQVFLNIILNAEAAIKDAGRPGLLTITTERVNNHVNIMFTDNGCGIKKHILPRIFDPFFTTKDIGRGTGLGLSICYGIVVKHGGKISVRSRVNEGTTFTVKLPVAPPM
jgi:PAS domain S-box-containing protein